MRARASEIGSDDDSDEHLGQSCFALLWGPQRVEPVQQVRVVPPSRWAARPGRAIHLFEGAPLALDVPPRIVVRLYLV